MDIVVIGGSICGLMHGVLLKGLGHNVRILEMREPQQLAAEAAALSVGPQAQELMSSIGLEVSSYAIPAPKVQVLGTSGEVLREMTPAFPLATSNWNIIFDLLKARLLDNKEGSGKASYETGARVIGVSHNEPKVNVVYEYQGTHKRNNLSADLVIGADGSRSAVRSIVKPDIVAEYVGYVAWRGCVPERLVPQKLKAVFEEKTAMTLAKGSYVLLCPSPGPEGSLEVGERLMDWVWYENCDKSSQDYERIMTDSMGHSHNSTIPKGFLDESIWRTQVQRADALLPKLFADMICKTGAPFITAITDHSCPQAAFYDGKLLLCGDAFTQFRPHLGLGCNLAAFQALSIAQLLRGEITLRKWEEDSVAYAREFSYRSTAMGHFGLTGRFPEGYVPLSNINS